MKYERIGIAGAGLLGRLLAWQLRRRGAEVSLFEAGSFTQPEAAAQTAAGMIAPILEAIAGEPYVYGLGNFSLTLWPQWLQTLLSDTGQKVDYAHKGSLLVAHPQDIAELSQFESDIARTLVSQGIDVPYQRLNARGVNALEPALSDRLSEGLFLPGEAHLDNRHLLRALLNYCRKNNVECHEKTSVAVAAGRIDSLTTSHTFDLVLDCRGVGAKPQWQQVRGVRGEVMRVQTNEVTLNRPVRLMHPRYQLYVAPKPNNIFVIGATQLESEDRSGVTLQSTLELGSALYTLSPAFAEANILELQSNLRPALPNNRPHIDIRNHNLIKINGLFRHGYLLAPAIIAHLLNWLDAGEPLPYDHLLGLSPINQNGSSLEGLYHA